MLVEQRHFDRSLARAETLAKQIGGHGESVGADFSRFECFFELGGRKQANTSQATAVPIHEFADFAAGEAAAEAEVFLRGRIGNEHEAGHSRFEDDGVAGIEMDDDPFADAADVAEFVVPTTRRRKWSMRGVMAIGRRAQRARSTSLIRAPTTPRMPRRIVSTSGSSGIIKPRRHGEHGESDAK